MPIAIRRLIKSPDGTFRSNANSRTVSTLGMATGPACAGGCTSTTGCGVTGSAGFAAGFCAGRTRGWAGFSAGRVSVGVPRTGVAVGVTA